MSHREQNWPVRRDVFSFRVLEMTLALWSIEIGNRVTGSAMHMDAMYAIIPIFVMDALTFPISDVFCEGVNDSLDTFSVTVFDDLAGRSTWVVEGRR